MLFESGVSFILWPIKSLQPMRHQPARG